MTERVAIALSIVGIAGTVAAWTLITGQWVAILSFLAVAMWGFLIGRIVGARPWRVLLAIAMEAWQSERDAAR